jgi:hypothetical protein
LAITTVASLIVSRNRTQEDLDAHTGPRGH